MVRRARAPESPPDTHSSQNHTQTIRGLSTRRTALHSTRGSRGLSMRRPARARRICTERASRNESSPDLSIPKQCHFFILFGPSAPRRPGPCPPMHSAPQHPPGPGAFPRDDLRARRAYALSIPRSLGRLVSAPYVVGWTRTGLARQPKLRHANGICDATARAMR